MSPGTRVLPFYLLFFLSGASALIYQIVWHRMLTLVFGVRTISVAAVVAAFLAGMALGAWWFGPVVDASRNRARLYAKIEIGIAASGVVSYFLIPVLMTAFIALYGWLAPGWLLSNVLRFILAFLSFGAASILLGATVPAMAALVASSGLRVARGFSRFYAINTAGSVAGAAAAGFWLIPAIGVRATLAVAVAGNLVAGLVALLLRAPVADDDGAPGEQLAPHRAVPSGGPADRRFILGAALLTGFAALGYEVVWTRLMAVYTLNSVYVFTMVISVYLLGIALGAVVVDLLLKRVAQHTGGALCVVQGLLAWMAPVQLALVPLAINLRLDAPRLGEATIFWREYLLAVLLVLLPALMIGMGLPLIVALWRSEVTHAGRTVGRVYAWNALGTITGAALTGVLLVPLLGIRRTLLLLAAVNFVVLSWAAVRWVARSARLTTGLSVAGLGFVLLVALLPANEQFIRPTNRSIKHVLYYAEGPAATVHVGETDADVDGERYRLLFIDSQSVAGTNPEIVVDQKMLAHLPLMLHPQPARALTVGFGTGGTSYSMLLHGVEVHCAEIELSVPATSALFASENLGLVGPDHEGGMFHLINDDARAWLQVAPAGYDVIVTDLTSIQYRGNGNLYTADYFRLMQQRLADGGLGCAWVPITGVLPEQLKILVRTFASVFAHTSVWYLVSETTDFVILVGSPEPLQLDLPAMTRRWSRPPVKRDLAIVNYHRVEELVGSLLLAGEAVDRYVGPGPMHTDDKPILDYLTHASPYQDTLVENLGALLAERVDAAAFVSAWPDANGSATWPAWHAALGEVIRGHLARRGGEPDAAAVLFGAAADAQPASPLIGRLADR